MALSELVPVNVFDTDADLEWGIIDIRVDSKVLPLFFLRWNDWVSSLVVVGLVTGGVDKMVVLEDGVVTLEIIRSDALDTDEDLEWGGFEIAGGYKLSWLHDIYDILRYNDLLASVVIGGVLEVGSVVIRANS